MGRQRQSMGLQLQWQFFSSSEKWPAVEFWHCRGKFNYSLVAWISTCLTSLFLGLKSDTEREVKPPIYEVTFVL